MWEPSRTVERTLKAVGAAPRQTRYPVDTVVPLVQRLYHHESCRVCPLVLFLQRVSPADLSFLPFRTSSVGVDEGSSILSRRRMNPRQSNL